MYLEKKGYKNYVIYEKDNRVGGKCYSPKVKMGPDDKEERTVEMGAIMGAKTYYAVHEAEEFGGVEPRRRPSMSRIYRDSQWQRDLSLRSQKDFSFKKLFDLLKLKKGRQTVGPAHGNQIRRL
jgi:monoamine oxidase